MVRVDRAGLCVESGRVEESAGGLALRTPGIRAVVAAGGSRAAAIGFTYLGPTRASEPLASGELRRQIGLKLRAHDTCNVVYVTWHIEPTHGIHVAVKSNPGRTRHEQCGDRGYRNVVSELQREPRPIRIGERRRLEARIDGDRLRVRADGEVVWEGRLPAEAFASDGPAGLRSDNAEFDLELDASPGPPATCP